MFIVFLEQVNYHVLDVNKVIEYIKKDIEGIKEYDTDRKIYTGEAVIDMLKVLLDVLEG